MDAAYGRGFDLKFPLDALVCVVDATGKLDLTEANQMVGRSSRSQGVCHGRIWTVTQQAFGPSVSVEQVLRQREVVDDNDGPTILRALLKIWDAGIEHEQELIRSAFSQNRWQTSLGGMQDRGSQDAAVDLVMKAITSFY